MPDLDLLSWLLAPIDPTRPHAVDAAIAWHGRLMVLAWAVLLPLGVLTARFFKVTPRQKWPEQLDNKAWWHAHRALQYAGGIAAALAAWLIWRSWHHVGSAGTHALLGWSTLLLCCAQFLGGWLRGSKGGPTDAGPDGSLAGDHFDMTRWRCAFERIHKSAGYLALLLACAAILTGLWHADAPRWMWAAVAAWWCVLLGAFVVLQRRGYAIDTYYAIWGPDPALPGNQRKPIGWGVRRPQVRS